MKFRAAWSKSSSSKTSSPCRAAAKPQSAGQKAQIRADIAAIQETLAQRRHQLEGPREEAPQLQPLQLQPSKDRNLAAPADRLQSAEINTLRASLDEAKTTIENLDTKVDSLNTTVTEVTAQRDSTENRNVELANELNTCYYAIGNKERA